MGGSIGVSNRFYDSNLSDEEGYYSIDGMGKSNQKEEGPKEIHLHCGLHRTGNVNPAVLDVPYINRYPFNEYRFLKKIGMGKLSVIYKAVSLKNEKEKYAIKEVKTHEMNKVEFDELRYEINVLSQLSHVSIMKLHCVYDSSGPNSKFFMVLEYIRGGELLRSIINHQSYTEEDVIHFAYQIISGLHYMHTRDVIHGNLVPENIVLTNQRFEDRVHNHVKLVGFDHMETVRNRKFDKVGKEVVIIDEQFRSPELLEFSQSQRISGSKPSDIWSFGVFLYLLLSGNLPFQDSKVVVLNPMTSFSGIHWGKVSFTAKELLSKLLHPDAAYRISSSEVVNNAWIQTDFMISPRPKDSTATTSEEATTLINTEGNSVSKRGSTKSGSSKPVLTLNHNLPALEEFQRRRYFFLERNRGSRRDSGDNTTEELSPERLTIYRFLSNDFTNQNSPPKIQSLVQEAALVKEQPSDVNDTEKG